MRPEDLGVMEYDYEHEHEADKRPHHLLFIAVFVLAAISSGETYFYCMAFVGLTTALAVRWLAWQFLRLAAALGEQFQALAS